MLTAQSCLTNTKIFEGVINFCKDGLCVNKSLLAAITPASVSLTTCINMITSQNILITLSSTGSSYIIDDITVSFTR